MRESESDDTDASDEEADEDASEVDKENQHPTDCAHSDHVDIKLTELSQANKQTMSCDRYCWVKKYFVSPNTDFSGPNVTDAAVSLHTPLEYFQRFVSEDMIQALTKNTNEYSFKKTGTSINTNTKDIEQVLGMYLKMGWNVWSPKVLGGRHTIHVCF